MQMQSRHELIGIWVIVCGFAVAGSSLVINGATLTGAVVSGSGSLTFGPLSTCVDPGSLVGLTGPVIGPGSGFSMTFRSGRGSHLLPHFFCVLASG
jgi:hypothetical protein